MMLNKDSGLQAVELSIMMEQLVKMQKEMQESIANFDEALKALENNPNINNIKTADEYIHLLSRLNDDIDCLQNTVNDISTLVSKDLLSLFQVVSDNKNTLSKENPNTVSGSHEKANGQSETRTNVNSRKEEQTQTGNELQNKEIQTNDKRAKFISILNPKNRNFWVAVGVTVVVAIFAFFPKSYGS
eukprot:gb/GECH01007163.1/.p1 GENE.gb/GECH01007163.1/~~gb/GECH01007163.1/.p1  ORF type:complete len:187 (+),score=40.23 gb/GECH01007163.1/:1-561(+)